MHDTGSAYFLEPSASTHFLIIPSLHESVVHAGSSPATHLPLTQVLPAPHDSAPSTSHLPQTPFATTYPSLQIGFPQALASSLHFADVVNRFLVQSVVMILPVAESHDVTFAKVPSSTHLAGIVSVHAHASNVPTFLGSQVKPLLASHTAACCSVAV